MCNCWKNKNKLLKNEENDIHIVFNTKKYGNILITNNGDSRKQPKGIWGNKVTLKALGIEVMRDYEAVSLVEKYINRRDKRLKLSNTKFGDFFPVG